MPRRTLAVLVVVATMAALIAVGPAGAQTTPTPSPAVTPATGTPAPTASPRSTEPAATVAPVGTLGPGAIVMLANLPYLWVADERGVLHWVGDTRALLNVSPNWGDQRTLSREQIVELAKAQRVGDPALSAGLVRLGETIYLVKWESDQLSPSLMQVPLLGDLEVFGVNGTNSGSVVMESAAWKERFGVAPESLPKGMLTSVVATPTPMPTATPVPTATLTPGPVAKMKARFEGRRRTGGNNEETESFFTITEALPRVRLKLTAWIREYQCSQGCTKGDPLVEVRWGPVDAGITDATGRLNYSDVHLPYQFYRYTFEDPYGNKVTVDGSDDL